MKGVPVTDLGEALDTMKNAAPGYAKAKAYSEGPLTEVLVSRKLRRLLKKDGRDFVDRLGDVVIDAVANKLKMTSISSDTEARTARIAEVDEAAGMALIRPAVNRRALQLGDAYLLAWPAPDADGDTVNPDQVRVSVWDPTTARVLYDDDQPGVARLAILRWKSGERVRADLIYADRIEHFRTKADGGSGSAADFEPYTPDGADDAVEPNPYGVLPLFHFHGTGLPGEYGVPEHASFYGTQNKLVKLTVGHMGSVDYNTIPQRVALQDLDGDTAEAADLDEDDFATLPGSGDTEQTRIAGGDEVSQLSSEPGSLWYLRGVRDVKQLDPSGASAFLDPIAVYLKLGALASSTPLHLFDRTGQIPSGESLKTANAPLDEKTGSRLLHLDSTWRAFYAFVLTLVGEEGAPVHIEWEPVESTDDTTRLAQAKARQEIGVPVGQTLREAGYRAEQVEQWLKDGDGGLPQRVELLGQLGDAMASMAQAVATGLVDETIARGVLDALLADVMPDGGD